MFAYTVSCVSQNTEHILKKKKQQQQQHHTYDTLIACQQANCPIRAVMYGNTYSSRPDNKCEASNRDPCYTFSIPKTIRLIVRFPLDIYVVSDREWL